MSSWISWQTLALAAPPIGLVFLFRWLGGRYPAVMNSIWLRGVGLPLVLVGLSVVPWIVTGQWYWVGILFAIVMATTAWVTRIVARDQAPPRWGSRSDLLGRLVLVVYAAAVALMGLEESRTPFGRTPAGGSRGFYLLGIAFLVAAVVMKPTWLWRRSKPA